MVTITRVSRSEIGWKLTTPLCDIPLVVSEVNPHALDGTGASLPKLIANPNCSTMQMVVALAPIQRAAGIERLLRDAPEGGHVAERRNPEDRKKDLLGAGGEGDLPEDLHRPLQG